MNGYINGFDWKNVAPMKYWSFPANTTQEVRKQTVHNAIFGGDYMGCLKNDGFYQRVLKDEDGNIFMIARDRNVKGEIVDKHEWVPQLQDFFESLPNGTCFLCEIYLPENRGSKNVTSILGCLKEKAIARQATTPLNLYVFDVMAYAGENFNKTPYEQRIAKVVELSQVYSHKFVQWAQPYEGKELWVKLQEYLANGFEGMVLMRKDAIVYDKRTPARVSIKCKMELTETIDCFFTGRGSAPNKEYTGKEIATWQYWYNTHTESFIEGTLYQHYLAGETLMPVTKSYFHHWAGSLEIGLLDADGNVVTFGWLSNLPEEMKAHPSQYKGRAIEVTAMELDYSNTIPTLRHGKMLQFRDDLTMADCTLEKVMHE